jgi:hypothetical protein
MISVRRRPQLRERLLWWVLGLAERCVFSVVPRGPLRRRLRDRIDWMLTRPRFERREHDTTGESDKTGQVQTPARRTNGA